MQLQPAVAKEVQTFINAKRKEARGMVLGRWEGSTGVGRVMRGLRVFVFFFFSRRERAAVYLGVLRCLLLRCAATCGRCVCYRLNASVVFVLGVAFRCSCTSRV